MGCENMADAEKTTIPYRTSDLYYAAYLRVAGVPLIETEKEGSRVFFVFERVETIRDLKREYFNRTARVPALSYADEIRNMKALTHM
tara:strand:+ start:203 stop:463 length:261 start_codon:yes stop_codon:yes gene_type:complete